MNAPATNVASRGAPTSHRTIRPTRVARPRPRRYRLRRLTARTEGSMVQFRKSKKVGPFRFTLTNRGVSSNVGAGPFRLSKGADGKLRRTIRVPAAGLYDTKVIGQPPQRRAAQTPRAAAMPSGWHADATDAPAAAPSARRRRVWPWVVGALIVLWLITTANSCVDGHTDANSRSVGVSTVTRTVTRHAPADDRHSDTGSAVAAVDGRPTGTASLIRSRLRTSGGVERVLRQLRGRPCRRRRSPRVGRAGLPAGSRPGWRRHRLRKLELAATLKSLRPKRRVVATV